MPTRSFEEDGFTDVVNQLGERDGFEIEYDVLVIPCLSKGRIYVVLARRLQFAYRSLVGRNPIMRLVNSSSHWGLSSLDPKMSITPSIVILRGLLYYLMIVL